MPSEGTIYGHTLNDLEKVQPYNIRHPETLKPSNDTVSYSNLHPNVYNPYVDRTSTSSRSRGEGSFAPCDNPWNNSNPGEVKVFPGHLKGFPEPSVGSYELLDIDNHIFFEKETRLGPYGYGDSVTIDWDTVNWGFVQRQCAAKNAGRYAPKDDDYQLEFTDTPSQREFLNRTAIVIRARAGTNFTENDKINIRSLINELSLGSGGEYQVFLLIEVTNSTNIMKDEKLYRQAVQSLVPKEFWDMTDLWSEKIIQNFYPKIPKNLTSARQSHWLALQRFSQIHSGFEYFWNWEIDSRYTGHHYDLLEKLSHFARVQPRKGLWERNERYYIPRIHGDYDTTFREAVGSFIWQPPKVEGVTPLGPEPPATKDVNYVWGVGEEADYISLSPIFNPNGTLWPDRDQIWGYGNIPRRATVLKQSRISRRLLDAMHWENLQGNQISSEMAPQTVALIHGLKAVYAPHPVFLDRGWQSESLEKWFNPGPNGESGSHIESPFGRGKDGWLKESTWYRESELAMKLYNNWIGMGKVGGPEVSFHNTFLFCECVCPFLC